MHSAVFSLEVSTWIVLWSIANSWLQMREASSKTIWELVLSSTGKIKFMLMLSYQKALSLRHYRDGNYEKLSDLFNRRTNRRYPIPSVELSIHLLDSRGLKFGSFTTWFRYILRNSQTIRGFIFSSDHLRCLSIRNDQDNPQSDLTWVSGMFSSGATIAAKSFIDRSRAGEES